MPVRTSSPASPLVGDVRIPGDGAVARVAVLLATAATGVSVVDGLPPGPRTDRLLAAAAALGAGVERTGDVARITGAGLGTLAEPSAPLDAGDDRALMALLLGLAATHPSTLVLTGDGAPLTDVIAPLARMGAAVTARSDGRPPFTVVGADRPVPLDLDRDPGPTAAAAVLLAGLNAPGTTRVPLDADPAGIAGLLRHFGAEVVEETAADGTARVGVRGERRLAAAAVALPGDTGLATVAAGAALAVHGSMVTLRGVGLSPGGTVALDLLGEMGAEIEIVRRREGPAGTVADLSVSADGRPSGLFVPPETTAALGDALALVAVAGAFGIGPLVLHGVGDAAAARIAGALSACGARAEADGADMIVHGGAPPSGGRADPAGDPALALALLVLGAGATGPVTLVDDADVGTAHPGAIGLLNALGARIGAAGDAS
ncbi:MAG: 3-phosphoshikimate 1-carboxyvinyltransferase [Rhodospirillales bacterium]